jgi:hypothetical protein
VEDSLRFKISVAGEDAVFSDRRTMDRERTPGEADESAPREDDLQMAYEEAVRRAAEWYRSRLFEPNTEHEQGAGPDAPAVPGEDETKPVAGSRGLLS